MAETTEAAEEKTAESAQADSQKQAQSAELSEAGDGQAAGSAASIDILLDMDIPVTVAVGRVEIPIQQLLQLGPGSVLKLDKSIDSPVDLYLKDTRFATGDVVIVDEAFAVRIREFLNAESNQDG